MHTDGTQAKWDLISSFLAAHLKRSGGTMPDLHTAARVLDMPEPYVCSSPPWQAKAKAGRLEDRHYQLMGILAAGVGRIKAMARDAGRTRQVIRSDLRYLQEIGLAAEGDGGWSLTYEGQNRYIALQVTATDGRPAASESGCRTDRLAALAGDLSAVLAENENLKRQLREAEAKLEHIARTINGNAA